VSDCPHEMKSLFVTIFVLFCISNSKADDDGKRLLLRLAKYQPCNGKPSPSEGIRLPSIGQAPIVEENEKGCYTIQGLVQVLRGMKPPFQAYIETKYGTKAPAEKCKGADNNNCGGVGSCVYCNICNGWKNITKKTSATIHLDTGSDKKFDCEKGVDKGNYTDGKLTFCMSTKKEFLQSQNMGEDFWNQYVADGRLFFVTIYTFNEPVNRLSTSELQQIATPDNEKVVGCHRMVGTVYEDN